MTTKRVKMRKIREILRLKQEKGLSHRSIARSLHLGMGTVSEYLAKAKEAGLSWLLPEEMDDAELEGRLFPRMQEPGYHLCALHGVFCISFVGRVPFVVRVDYSAALSKIGICLGRTSSGPSVNRVDGICRASVALSYQRISILPTAGLLR